MLVLLFVSFPGKAITFKFTNFSGEKVDCFPANPVIFTNSPVWTYEIKILSIQIRLFYSSFKVLHKKREIHKSLIY